MNAKLSTLDPTNTLMIHDWLIDLRAAAGTEFKACFVPESELESFFRLSEGYPTTEYSKAEISDAMSDWQTTDLAPLSKCCTDGSSTTSSGVKIRSSRD